MYIVAEKATNTKSGSKEGKNMADRSKKNNPNGKEYDPVVKFLQGRQVSVCYFMGNGKPIVLRGLLHQATKSSRTIAGHLVLEYAKEKYTVIAGQSHICQRNIKNHFFAI